MDHYNVFWHLRQNARLAVLEDHVVPKHGAEASATDMLKDWQHVLEVQLSAAFPP